jgi:hypothetical protein
MNDQPRNRRIDRILEPSYLEGLGEADLEALRAKRDECLAEREYLSLLRRLLQGRAEILRAELEGRASSEETPALVDRLATILADDDHPVSSRGELVRVALPEEELLLARRRVERLVNDVGLSDPGSLDDDALAAAIGSISTEEEGVSASRRDVIAALDAVQDELKRRYKDDPTLALR